MLREQGFERVLLLLGYMAEVIAGALRRRQPLRARDRLLVTGADDLTASRVRVAAALLDDRFLLLYCDNYWPMRFDAMWEPYVALEPPRPDHRLHEPRRLHARQRDRRARRHGRGLRPQRAPRRGSPASRSATRSSSARRCSPLLAGRSRTMLFEHAVYPPLAERGELRRVRQPTTATTASAAHARLPLTEAFLAREPAVILDRDGTLNERPPRAEYVTRPGRVRLAAGRARGAARCCAKRATA